MNRTRLMSTLTVLLTLLMICTSNAGALAIIHPAEARAAITQIARTVYVAPTGNDAKDCMTRATACKTIGAAIGKAADGDTLSIAGGLYRENLIIGKNLTLVGEATTIIDGNQAGTVVTIPTSITVSISQVIIQNGKTSNLGGGILNSGALTLTNSTIRNNSVTGQFGGGGIYSSGGQLTLIDSTVSGNSSANNGGGILNFSQLVLRGSTVSGNTAAFFGGGIDSGSSFELTNSTISNNSASYAGGIRSAVSLVSTNSTIASNSATNEGSGLLTNGTAILKNTILAGNATPTGTPQDCLGTLTSQGYNLLGTNNGCSGVAHGVNGDQVGTAANPIDPRLGPLQDNGGPTWTRALLPSSPAIDSANPAPPGSGGTACAAADQRGIARPRDGNGDDVTRCDIGAYELELLEQASLDLTKTVSTPTAHPGETLSYTLTITAHGGAVTATLTDTLPLGLIYLPGSLTGASYDTATRQIRFRGRIAPGMPQTITYRATVASGVPAGSILNNTAEVSGAEELIRRSVPVSIPVPESVFNGTLVLIYANGDNDPQRANSLSAAVQKLINRAELAASNPNIVVLVVLDGPGDDDSRLYRLQPLQTGEDSCIEYVLRLCGSRYIEGQNVRDWREDLGDPDSLTAFLTGAISAYSGAKQVVLSLVGHGGGWAPEVRPGQPSGHKGQPGDDPLGGMLWDDHPGNSLSTPDLGEALDNVRKALLNRPSISEQRRVRPIDLLFLDACSMAMAEVAYEVRNSVGYLLASENWKWAAFPYDAHLSTIDQIMSAEGIGKTWLSTEANALRRDAQSLQPSDFPNPFTYSLINLQQMDQVQGTLNGLAVALRDAIRTNPASYAAIRAAFDSTDCFDSNQDGVIVKNGADQTPADDNYCDIASFARKLLGQFDVSTPIGGAATNLQAAIKSAIVLEDHNGGFWNDPSKPWVWENLGGLSIFLPLSEDTWRRRYYGALQFTQGDNGLWDDFLAQWWAGHPLPPDPTCPPSCDLPPGPEPLDSLRLNATSGYSSIRLQWQTPDWAVSTYRILRAPDGSIPTTAIATSDSTDYFDADGSLIAGQRYCYRVEALQNAAPVAISAPSCATLGSTTLYVRPENGAAPGRTDLVPINLGPARGLHIGRIEIRLEYAPTVIEPTGIVQPLLPSGQYQITSDISTPGVVTISAVATTTTPTQVSGGQTLFGIVFQAKSSVGTTSTLSLNSSGTAIYPIGNPADAVPLALGNGLFTISNGFTRGSLDGNNSIQAQDTALALNIASGRRAATWQQQNAGDINGDHVVSARDASMIAYYGIHGHWPGVPSSAINSYLFAQETTATTVRLSLDSVSGAPGATVTTTLRAANLADWAGGEFLIAYDPALIDHIAGVEIGDLPGAFQVAFSDNRAGILRIAVAGGIPVTGNRSLLKVALHIATTARSSRSGQLRLAEAQLNDVAGRDFVGSALARQVEHSDGVVHIGSTIYLPMLRR